MSEGCVIICGYLLVRPLLFFLCLNQFKTFKARHWFHLYIKQAYENATVGLFTLAEINFEAEKGLKIKKKSFHFYEPSARL